MIADTPAQGDLIALAEKFGFTIGYRSSDGDCAYWASPKAIEAFAAALQGRGTQEGEPSLLQRALDVLSDTETSAETVRAARLHHDLVQDLRAALAQAQKERP